MYLNPYLHFLTFYGLPLVQRTKPNFYPQNNFVDKRLPCHWQIVSLLQNMCDALKRNIKAPAVCATIKCRAQQTEPESWQPVKTKKRTQERQRKDTKKKRQAIFSATKPSLGYRRHPDGRI